MFRIQMKSLISSLMQQKENEDNMARARVTNPSNFMSRSNQNIVARVSPI
jgi:hypothetical protein